MDGWPPVKVKPMRGECPNAYKKRAEQIRKIVEGFRHGLFTGTFAEEMDQMLEHLRRPTAQSANATPRL